ncbi:MAG: Fic family protein, partial [Alphaproteobacteria bacterium]|nr:Fic family protein [Alphaproteobacteria bacterium]
MLQFSDVIKFWQEKKISTVAQLEAAINGKIVSLAYHSAKIENNSITYNDTREIFEHDSVIQYTGDLRTLFEIRNSKDAFLELLSAF